MTMTRQEMIAVRRRKIGGYTTGVGAKSILAVGWKYNHFDGARTLLLDTTWTLWGYRSIGADHIAIVLGAGWTEWILQVVLYCLSIIGESTHRII
ncbi:hypothetical protein DEU56DRAFT_837658 [Suillus clintonianus]|uniref:uncharacterized protein n=1 Tax=Suillus clintonianus TaxID=1904413 RepID=UPI001B878477|nr:uncharacterized protein DEU56DRAFT_837658 [Suillus clintonianus]KAG2118461.1 hypothetical protein DEU56DRAFT_837658 [Suillus clintonianus]